MNFITQLSNTYLFRFTSLTQNFYILDVDDAAGVVNCYDEQDTQYAFSIEGLTTMAEAGKLSYYQLTPVTLTGYSSPKELNIMEMFSQKVDSSIKSFVDSSKT